MGTATLALRAAPLARPEELGCWLRNAEDFLALVLARELNWLRRGCWSIVGVVVASLLSLALAVVSYPFQPRDITQTSPAKFAILEKNEWHGRLGSRRGVRADR